MNALAAYNACTLRLDTVLRTVRGESPQADEIRDEMDSLWKKLTAEEMAEARKFSVVVNDCLDRIEGNQ